MTTTNRLHRRSIRLPEYDYTQAGAYYLTVCTHERECLFGDIVDGEMVLNPLGEIVHYEWLNTAIMRPYVEIDEFVVMPNHLHGVLVIHEHDGFVDANDDTGSHSMVVGARGPVPLRNDVPERKRQNNDNVDATTEQFGRPVSQSIPTIIRSFKAVVTKRINVLRQTPRKPVWQRNYYEHVVRGGADLDRIRGYIANNPKKWADDIVFVVPEEERALVGKKMDVGRGK